MPNESYVVRIYRRPRDDATQIVGIVEAPGGGRQAAFRDAAELGAILAQPRRHLRRPPPRRP